ncbi:hypothetical protein JCGZ_26579 [Jatropha curcas]|uniref:Uncharacterized protein n=1 Tax=Jatropha curcas TaxID=180498 RepID=A0A067JWL7_JATCU|nr:hypothetical protein JCGZ_26579 [Jatropha curcas]
MQHAGSCDPSLTNDAAALSLVFHDSMLLPAVPVGKTSVDRLPVASRCFLLSQFRRQAMDCKITMNGSGDLDFLAIVHGDDGGSSATDRRVSGEALRGRIIFSSC